MSIAQMLRHGQRPALADFGGSFADRHGCAVALGRSGQIKRGMGEKQIRLRQADKFHRLRDSLRDQKRVRIRQSNVLAGTNHQSARDEPHLFASM